MRNALLGFVACSVGLWSASTTASATPAGLFNSDAHLSRAINNISKVNHRKYYYAPRYYPGYYAPGYYAPGYYAPRAYGYQPPVYYPQPAPPPVEAYTDNGALVVGPFGHQQYVDW
jgi:hypothetical protein